MNPITQTAAAALYNHGITDKNNKLGKTDTTKKAASTEAIVKDNDYGKTIGTPTLSDAGKKYYESLKKKYGNMDFILVSEDMKASAQASAAQYSNPNKMVVLIDTDKIERMATDENYRKQYESIIDGSANQLSQIKSSLGANASKVKSFGMQINDGGTASFFAVVDKSMKAQKQRIEKKHAKAAAEKKQELRKEAKERLSERLDGKRTESTAGDEDTITIKASSMKELLKKIDDTILDDMSNNVKTEEEEMVGQHIDYKS